MKANRIAAALLGLSCLGAWAQSAPTPAPANRALHRNVHQQQRIEAGVDDGSLTLREAARLERGQARVARQESRAGRDGRVTAGEQQHIERIQDRQSRRIFRQRHDRQQNPV